MFLEVVAMIGLVCRILRGWVPEITNVSPEDQYVVI